MATDSHLPDADVERVVARALQFARERLGPASEDLLASSDQQALLLSRLRGRSDLEDAVLALVHRAAGQNRRVADEFVAYFFADLMRLGRSAHVDSLRRFLDTGDLVQSVLGDLWPELAAVRFEGRARFLAYLGKRLSWKAADRGRSQRAAAKRDGERARKTDEARAVPSPLSDMMTREERDQLILRILRLPERDRALIAMHLRGEPIEAIARELDLSRDAAYKALQRAVRRARRLP